VHRAMAVAAAVAVLGLCWGGVGVASAQRTADEAPMELIVPLDSPGELWARGFTGTRCLQYTVVSLSANRSFTAIFQVEPDTTIITPRWYRPLLHLLSLCPLA
jgi:hypothetical protein